MTCGECLLLLEGFVEKEMEARSSQGVEMHVAACPPCARAYAEQVQENEVYTSYVLDVEASPALWEGLRAAIREENAARARSRLLRMRRRLASLPSLLLVSRASGGAPPFVAASLLLAAAFFYTQRPALRDVEPAPIAAADTAAGTPATLSRVAERVTPDAARTPTGTTETGGAPKQMLLERERRRIHVPAQQHYAVPAPALGDAASLRRERSVAARPPSGEPAYLVAGEQAYRKPIAELAGQIKARGERALPPALRAEYRRGLAVVDRAIAAIREDTLRHPEDPNLAEFLRAAYKGKLDLLASVAEQGEAARSNNR